MDFHFYQEYLNIYTKINNLFLSVRIVNNKNGIKNKKKMLNKEMGNMLLNLCVFVFLFINRTDVVLHVLHKLVIFT